MTDQSITVFRAQRILTMNPSQPSATHVAVREGRILAVGTAEDVAAWGEHTLDERYADHFLMPGLVEGHSHLYEGAMWRYTYVGFYDRQGPDGQVHPGLKSLDAVVQRLEQAQHDLAPDEVLVGWGFDPIFFESERMTVRDLDRISSTRPVVVRHASLHLMNVNTPALEIAGITRDTDIEGVVRFADGEPTGELQEFAAMFPVNRTLAKSYMAMLRSEESVERFGRVSQHAGVTTATDLVNDLNEEALATLSRVTARPDYPVRIVPAASGITFGRDVQACLARLEQVKQLNHDKLHLGMVKLVIDGSIQGFTARLRWPGYHNGAPNGIWVIAPDDVMAIVQAYHDAGIQLHIHTNGDEATEVAIDAIENAMRQSGRLDHRHTLQHCQMADTAQFRRMARLGICVNLFSNHIYYWGDAHYAQTMGPDRANRMNACGTAQRLGVPFAMHSDAPITPLGPLFTAWCAVNRRTASGRVLGENERIEVEDALRAITLGAAYTLHMDDRIGSIEVGKFADFCVLAQDPLKVNPEDLKDIPILGTVVGGRPLALPEA